MAQAPKSPSAKRGAALSRAERRILRDALMPLFLDTLHGALEKARPGEKLYCTVPFSVTVTESGFAVIPGETMPTPEEPARPVYPH